MTKSGKLQNPRKSQITVYFPNPATAAPGTVFESRSLRFLRPDCWIERGKVHLGQERTFAHFLSELFHVLGARIPGMQR